MSTQRPPSQAGCAWVEECIEMCTGHTVYVEDDGVRATFLNPRGRKIRKVHYDGCYAAKKGRQADFILGLPRVVDVIIELKGSDTNLKDAASQIESSLESWKRDPKRHATIAALIIYGRIEGKKKLPGRVPRTAAVILGLTAEFLKVRGIRLLIHENGERQFTFNDFLRKNNAE
ncbi:MAG: hypothetical protein ABR905_00995 [Terracidiphilus sp.]